MKLALLDVGTNSMHVVVVDIARDGAFAILAHAHEMTLLGDGTLRSGWLSDRKAETAVNAATRLVSFARRQGARRFVGIVTGAVRDASNGEALLSRIGIATGVSVRSIGGDEEARLVYRAVRQSMMLSRAPALIVDIGGGTGELVVATDREALFARSLRIGGALLRDLFIACAPVDRGDHEHVHRYLRDALAQTLEEVHRYDVRRAIGTSGTLRNIAALIRLKRGAAKLASTHGLAFDVGDLRSMHAELTQADERKLRSIPSLEPERRALLLPGTCATLEIMDALALEQFTICDAGTREGALLEIAEKHAARHRVTAS